MATQQEPKDKLTGVPDNNDTKAAHDMAERDIAADPELSSHHPNDDLDEGELARLGDNDGVTTPPPAE